MSGNQTGPLVDLSNATPPAPPAPAKKKPAGKRAPRPKPVGGVKTPRTTKPRPTDPESRAKWKAERHKALGGQ